MCKCVNNVCIKKILCLVKFLQNLCCFVEKVSNGAILRFSVAFFVVAYFGSLCYFLAFFLSHYLGLLGFYAVLSWIRFVVIYALFQVKLFWLRPLWIFLEMRYLIWRYAELNHLLVGSGQIPLNIELKQDDYTVCCIHSVVDNTLPNGYVSRGQWMLSWVWLEITIC